MFNFLTVVTDFETDKTTKTLHVDQESMEAAVVIAHDSYMEFEVYGGVTIVCEWFAKCENPADHIEGHPVIPGGVPCCGRCASIGR